MTPSRDAVWRMLGEPSDQEGSVNDPRTRIEQGVRWNEKWIYRGEDGAVERIVLWHRYDLAGAFSVQPDGSLEPEKLDGG